MGRCLLLTQSGHSQLEIVAVQSMAFAVHQWRRGYHLIAIGFITFACLTAGVAIEAAKNNQGGSHSGSPVTIESGARNSNPAREALKDAARTLAREKRYGGKTYPT